MTFTFPPHRPQFWPLGGLSLSRHNSRRDSSDSRTSDKKVPEKGCTKITPDTSLNESFNGPPAPSKCLMRRISLPRTHTESSSSSSDTIKEQLQAWSNLKLNTSSESELDVRSLLLQTPCGAPVFSSRLVREFRDNYDSPDAGDGDGAMRIGGDADDAAHVLRQAHWKYSSPSFADRVRGGAKAKASAPGAGSPDTATTAPPSFSIDEHHHGPDGDGAEEGDISAITTDQEHNVLVPADDAAAKSMEPSPRAARAPPPTLRASHLEGLRQLLWPDLKDSSEPRPGLDLAHRPQCRVDDEACGPHSTAATSPSIFTGSLIRQVTALTCCGALMTPPGAPEDRAFASRSDDDSHLILDSSGSSLLQPEEDEEENGGGAAADDDGRAETNRKSIFRTRELKIPMKEISKAASLVTRCTRRTFDADPDASANRTGDSALEDTLNWDFLSLHTDAFADDDEVDRSRLSSYVSDHLFNEFLTLDDSTVGSEPAVSEASVATAPRTNIFPDDTVSTTTKSIVMGDRSIHHPVFIDDRPVFMDAQRVCAQDRPAFMKEPAYGDEDEPPPLHLSEQARKVLLREQMKFQY